MTWLHLGYNRSTYPNPLRTRKKIFKNVCGGLQGIFFFTGVSGEVHDREAQMVSRLGVGAPAPEKSTLSREGDRLRHRLTQKNTKKRSIEDTHFKPPESHSSDEGESRAGAIGKRPKLDIFDTKTLLSPKKRKAGPSSSPASDALAVVTGEHSSDEVNRVDTSGSSKLPKSGPPAAQASTSNVETIPTFSKKNKKKTHQDQETETEMKPAPESLNDLLTSNTQTDGEHETASDEIGLPLNTANKVLEPDLDSTALSSRSTKILTSPVSFAPPSSQLLNLFGPPPISDTSPDSKKKRKRRRNKHKNKASKTTSAEGQ
jgi:hypothetical protein